MGKVVRKAFRILELDERKGRWVVEQDFKVVRHSKLMSLLNLPFVFPPNSCGNIVFNFSSNVQKGYRGYYMAARGYKLYLSRASELVRDTFSTRR